MNTELAIESIKLEVKEALQSVESGHDWLHIQRVYKNAMLIAAEETNLDIKVVKLAALLHDIADPKFHDGNETLGAEIAEEMMMRNGIDKATILHVVNIIKNMSYRSSLDNNHFLSIELDIVSDADKLDAIGAVGIARAFTYGGYKKRTFYDPMELPKVFENKEQYRSSKGPTINHFYEKLLKLKDVMKTKHGKVLAGERHEFLLQFLKQFHYEIGIDQYKI